MIEPFHQDDTYMKSKDYRAKVVARPGGQTSTQSPSAPQVSRATEADLQKLREAENNNPMNLDPDELGI